MRSGGLVAEDFGDQSATAAGEFQERLKQMFQRRADLRPADEVQLGLSNRLDQGMSRLCVSLCAFAFGDIKRETNNRRVLRIEARDAEKDRSARAVFLGEFSFGRRARADAFQIDQAGNVERFLVGGNQSAPSQKSRFEVLAGIAQELQ